MNYAEKLVKGIEEPKEAFRDLCSDANGRLTFKDNSFSCTINNPKRVTLSLNKSGEAVLEDIE